MVLVGTAGFSYSDWRGSFYPSGWPQRRMLEFYASKFAAVELDYTYYRMPIAKNMASMAERTPAQFDFCVKAFRGMTHERPCSIEETRVLFGQFREALDPLHQAGKLGCVLLQFPWSFRPDRESVAYLKTCSELLGGWATSVEFRNATWVDERWRERLLGLLTGLNFGFCCVDEPQLKSLMPPVVAWAAEPGYVRFHGRNARKWWRHEHASQRYDYLYSRTELAEWAAKIRRLTGQVEKTYVFFNNCHAGQAATNASTMLELLRPPD